jgi:histidinol phosphatase-like enzyme
VSASCKRTGRRIRVNCQCRKPQIGMFQELLQKWNISSDKTKFIGNTDSDMEAASRLNIPYLSVNEDDFNLQSLERFIRC